MARQISLLITLADKSHNAGLSIFTATSTWDKSEAGGLNNVFKIKSGPYRMLSSDALEIMRPGGGLRVGRLAGFDPTKVVEGAHGSGLSDDAGEAIFWTVNAVFDN